MTPESYSFSYHSLTGRKAFPLHDGAKYKAVTIGMRSDVDKAIIVIGGERRAISTGSPLIVDIHGTLWVEPFYVQGPTAGVNGVMLDPPTRLELELWPELPTVWPVGRGPIRRAEVEATSVAAEAQAGSEFPIYGRRRVVAYLRESAGVSVDVRIEVGRVRAAGTVDWNAIWPTAGDETAFETIAALGFETMVHGDGGELLRVMTQRVSTDATLHVAWEAED